MMKLLHCWTRTLGLMPVLCLVSLSLAQNPAAFAEDTPLAKVVALDVAAQPLEEAVLELSRQSGLQIVVDADRVEGSMAGAVRGTMTVEEALRRLLEGTELEARAIGPKMIAIAPARTAFDELLDAGAAPPTAALDSADSAAAGPSNEPARAVNRRVVEEIIVTANRRSQNLQEVASAIRVLDGEALEQAGVRGFEDYIFRVPGVDLADSGLEKKIAIRGISNVASSVVGANGSASPIGIYLNDTPIQGNGVLPNLTLYDLERIEVLKGPQGTLYGEGAQGGAIKMILPQADPTALDAKVEATVGRTRFGGGLNHSQGAMVNVPLVGSWAVRLVGSRRADQGYIDFPNRGTRDENDATNLMGRLHVDGSILDGLDLSLMVLHQTQRLDQFPNVQKSEGDLRNREFEPAFIETDFTLAGFTLDYDLPFATLTSSTSWFRSDRQTLARFPFVGALLFANLFPILGGGDIPTAPGVEREWITTDNLQGSIAQELRLVSATDSWIDWIVGGFYRTRDNDFDYILENDQTSLVREFGVESFEQFAGFGEATLALPWDLELSAGVRIFRESSSLIGTSEGRGAFVPIYIALGGPGAEDGTIGPLRFDTVTTQVSPKVSLAWFPDESRMLYAIAANGVRSGGTNAAITSNSTPFFEPDSLWTYEVGAKTQWFDGLLTANLSLFYNDWTDLQVLTVEPSTYRGGTVANTSSVILNAGEAFSRGAELELLALPIDGLTLGFNMALIEGRISEGDPEGNIPDGAPLPQLSEFSYAASASWEALDFPLFGLTPFVSFDTQRVGYRTMAPGGVFTSADMEPFQLYNTMVGLANEQWDLSFGVRNLGDARHELGANILDLATHSIGPPRTWTARFAWRF